MNVPEALARGEGSNHGGVVSGVLKSARSGGVPGTYMMFREMLANGWRRSWCTY